MECLLFQPHPHKKKIPAEYWRAKKIICKRILEKKNFIVNQGAEKKFHDQTKSPTPPPPPLRSRMVGPLETFLMRLDPPCPPSPPPPRKKVIFIRNDIHYALQ